MCAMEPDWASLSACWTTRFQRQQKNLPMSGAYEPVYLEREEKKQDCRFGLCREMDVGWASEWSGKSTVN